MKKINCIVADDEKLAREVIENYINKVDELNLVVSCSTGTEVYNYLQNNQVDLLFLDIEMPELNGIALLKTLKNPPSVIMTTAYREFALEGYELNVLDYLLKPVSFERFLKAIDKYNHLKGLTRGAQDADPAKAYQDAEAFIYIRADHKMVRILISEILYLEGLKDCVKVQTKEKAILTYHTLSYFEEKLPINRFMRVHRSFIIGFEHIRSYTATEIEILDQGIPIGITYSKAVIKRIESTT